MKFRYLVGLAVAATPLQAHAATMVFSEQDVNTSVGASTPANPNSDDAAAEFAAWLGGGTITESFEGFLQGATTPLALNFTGSAGSLGAVLTGGGSVSGSTRSLPSATGQYATDGSQFYLGSNNFTITFDNEVGAVGFYTTDVEDLANVDVTLNYAAGGSQTYNFQALFGPPYSGPYLASGSVHFLGFADNANPFKSIVFGGSNAIGEVFGLDKVMIGDIRQVDNPPGAVPEPATWAMLILGFGAVGATLRRRQGAKLSFA